MSLILNILRKVQEDGFVKYEDGNFKDKDDNVIDVAQSSTNQVPKIAYASDVNGTGFTLTNNTALEYIAVKSFAADYAPVVADFAGLWYHRKGLPGAAVNGADGADGQPSGFATNFSTATDAVKPGTGKIKFNNADLSLATEMYLDELSPAAVDLSGVINTFAGGMLFSLSLKSDPNTTLAVYELTAAPTDNGDWFTIPVTNRALSSNTFSDASECVFQIFGGGGSAAVTEAAVIAAGNFARFADNGAGGLKMLDNANVEVPAASLVYKMPSITITGVSNLPAANTFPHGVRVRLHHENFVGAGFNPVGILLVADAVNNRWLPDGRQTLFWKNFGNLAAPTNSLTAAGKFTLGAEGDPVIPAGLLYAGAKLIFSARYRKAGATAPVMRIYIGTDTSAYENNSIVYNQTVSANTDQDVPARTEVTFVTTGTALCSNRSSLGGSGSQSAVIDASTLLDTTAAMKASIAATTLASDTIYLLEYGIVWEQ